MEAIARGPCSAEQPVSSVKKDFPESLVGRCGVEAEAVAKGDGVGCAVDASESFKEARRLHDALLGLERSLDAALEVGSLREVFGRQVVDNDAACVESCFRRKMVEEVYTALEREECLAKLDTPSPAGLDSLLVKGALSKEGPLFDLRLKEGKELQVEESTLLDRVLSHSTHPLLRAEKATEWYFPSVAAQSHSVKELQRESFCGDVCGGSHRRKVVDDGDALQVFLRNYDDNREVISFRLEGTVNAPLLSILSVFNEVDLFQEWVPYYKVPFRLGVHKIDFTSLGRVDKLVQLHVHFPWPFANRDVVIELFAVDDLERNGNIVVKMRTPDAAHPSPRDRVTPPPPEKGVSRIVVDGSLVIQPLSRDTTRISLVWNENCGMRVPPKMVDFVVKMFCRTAFERCRSVCQEAGTSELFVARRKANPALYGFIAERLEQLGLLGRQVEA